MEVKKNRKYDLENYKTSFLTIGFLFALVFVYFIIEWKTSDISIMDLGDVEHSMENEEIVVTKQEQPKIPPPPPPKVAEQIIIKEDDVKIDIPLEVHDQSDETVVDIPEDTGSEEEDIAMQMVEEKPIFPGCEKFKDKEEQYDCMNKKIFEHVRKEFVYPEIAKEMGVQGKVMVKFVINKKGKIDKIEIVRGIDKELDKEAVRIISKLRDKITFTPARQGDKAVNVSYVLPIIFKLQ